MLPRLLREDIVDILGTAGKRRATGHFLIYYDPAVEPLLDVADRTLPELHADVRRWCEQLKIPWAACPAHEVLLQRDRTAHARLVGHDRLAAVRESDGCYRQEAELVLWFDQRSGTGDSYRRALVARDLQSSHRNPQRAFKRRRRKRGR